MTALLELKQRIKNLYSQYEIYILPVLRFVLAMVYFIWINTNMGYMKQIDNIFRSCRFYACADPVYGNSLPEIQFRQ